MRGRRLGREVLDILGIGVEKLSGTDCEDSLRLKAVRDVLFFSYVAEWTPKKGALKKRVRSAPPNYR